MPRREKDWAPTDFDLLRLSNGSKADGDQECIPLHLGDFDPMSFNTRVQRVDTCDSEVITNKVRQ